MKVLIVKTSSLGDILQSFPVVAYLKKLDPNVQIDWVVEKGCAELVQSHPDIHEAIVVDTRAWRKNIFDKSTWLDIKAYRKRVRQSKYDYVIDLQGNTKSGLLVMLAKSNCKIGFGWSTVPEKPNLLFTNYQYNPPSGHNIREDYLYLVETHFKQKTCDSDVNVRLKISDQQHNFLKTYCETNLSKNKKNILICPGSAWTNKQLTPDTWKEFLAKFMLAQPCTYFFAWGTEKEKQFVNDLQQHFSNSLVLDKMPLPVLQNLMGKMDLVIAMDSLPLHLAGTTSTPTFSVFGASSANKYKPVGFQHRALQGTCPYGRTFEKRCTILRTCPTGACIKTLAGQDLIDNL